MSSIAYINPGILFWARKRLGDAGDSLFSFYKHYNEWESGLSKPTFKQAKELAKKLRIPFGYLYLAEPPKESTTTADLRTLKDREPGHYSVDLIEVIEDAIRKQDWYRDELIAINSEPLPFIGKFNLNSNPHNIAEDINEVLNVRIENREGQVDILRFFTDKAESAGILVLRNGKVGANTHRPLDVDEFRGFALSDEYAPLIFINSADYKDAQIFTLVHEIAHLWIGEGGVSNYHLAGIEKHSEIEVLCNQVAAEVLVPTKMFIKLWKNSDGSLQERVEILRKYFQVSTIVLARRAFDLGFVQKEDFFAYYHYLTKIWTNQKGKQSGGGSFHNTFPVANSKLFTDTVCHAVYSQKMLLRNGARLLGVKPATLDKYVKSTGGII